MSETAGPPQRAGRYQRSTSGLVGALLVTVVAVTAYALFNGVNRPDVAVRPEPVDYLSAVTALQESGREVVYPRELPAGWVATSVDVRPGERPVWGVGMLTDRGRFVGLRQADVSADDLLEAYVDEQTSEEAVLRVDGSVAPEWEAYADEGGDHAFVAEVTSDVGEETLLVYGSAPVADLETLIGLLVREPRQRSSEPSADVSSEPSPARTASSRR